MVEVFLPFDMEFTYGASMHVIMAGALFPNVTESQDYIKDAYAILDQMIQRGNRLAAARKSELVQLEKLFQELALRIERRGLETLILPGPSHSDPGADHLLRFDGNDDATLPGTDPIPLSVAGDPASPSVLAQAPNLDFLDSIGISSYDFFTLVDQIGHPESMSMNVLDSAHNDWEGSI